MAMKRDERGRFVAMEADGTQHESASEDPGAREESSAEQQAREAEEAIVQEVRDDVAFWESYAQAQLEAEKDAIEFEYVDMWPTDARTAREEHVDEATGDKIPDRPVISVNLLDQHAEQILNEAREARLSLTIKPKYGTATTEMAEHYKGLVRTIQVNSGAMGVRLWALQRTVRAGRGQYFIDADYANDGDMDLDLLIKRILDQSTVAWDPYATAVDQEDAGWVVIYDTMSVAERRQRWPKKPLREPEGGFQASGYSGWFNLQGENPSQHSLRVALFYKVETTDRALVFHEQHGYVFEDEATGEVKDLLGSEAGKALRRRQVQKRTITIYTVDGTQVLEKTKWEGRYIPVIQTVGKEYFAQGRRRWKGTNQDAASILEAINVVLSSAVEIAGTMPTTPYIMAEGQQEGHEEEWETAGTVRRNFLLYRAMELAGKVVAPPRREQTELQVQGLMLLLRVLQDFFHAVTGSVAPQLRAVNPYDRSGKAIDALQRQGAAGSSAYLDNLATISMPYEGKVLVDAIPKYYDRKGRIIRTTGDDGKDDAAIMLKTPFIRNEDGIPVPVPCPACEGRGRRGFVPDLQRVCPVCQGTGESTRETMPQEWQGKTVHYVDFGNGNEFGVEASLDRSYRTEQEEALAGMSELSRAAPNMVPAFAASWVRAMGFKGSTMVADAIDAMFPPPGQEFDGEKIPPRVLAELQRLKQQHELAMQALQEAQKLIETDAIKQAGQKEIATIKAAFTERLEQVRQQGKVLETAAKGNQDGGLAQMKGQIDLMLQQSEQRHEIVLQLLKEKGEKEVERHSVELHDRAAAAAEARIEGQTVRSEARDEGREQRAAAREEGQTVRAEGREEVRGRSSERREEDRTVRAEEREAAREPEGGDE